MTTDDKNGVMSQLLVNGETGYNRGDQQHQLAPTLLPEAVLLPSSGDLGLNGFSPGPGQDTYAAKFRSPCARSIEEEVSPLWKMTGEEILPSPGAASVKTASSFCWGDGGVGGEELSRETGRMIGVWAEEEQGDEEDRVVETEETTGREAEGKEEGGEAGEKKEKGKEEQEQEQESDDGEERGCVEQHRVCCRVLCYSIHVHRLGLEGCYMSKQRQFDLAMADRVKIVSTVRTQLRKARVRTVLNI